MKGLCWLMLLKTPLFSRYWILSLFLHFSIVLAFFFTESESENLIKLRLTHGSAISLYSRDVANKIGLGENSPSPLRSDTEMGTHAEEREIDLFRNALTYPELAIEQGLEDDCSFRVTVAENGQAEKLVVIAPCKYNVFDAQIRSQLREWKFNFPKGKDLVLPIRFRIHARE